ncbi:WYL domain-containing protein [Glaciecola sp. MH2013]|nr:WYL domain-containing protein [Glaciecola sp. MH2013]
MPHAQRERLAFIDFCLQFFGHITRNDLVSRFQTGLAACTRDFAAYRDLANSNLVLDHSTKQYYRTPEFVPLFKYEPDIILHSLSRGFGNGISHVTQPSEQCFDAVQLIHPDSSIIAALMRAIHNQEVCEVGYVSVSSGETIREFVPHALVNNGHRWHVRGFDCKNQGFRDFVCTRFTSITSSSTAIESHQMAAADSQFHQIIDVVLVPHPSIKNPRAIEMDFDMQNGRKVMHTRAALAAYILRQWQVDCSEGARITGQGCQLALENLDVLRRIENPSLAPGYAL